jgi:hypothetical protein
MMTLAPAMLPAERLRSGTCRLVPTATNTSAAADAHARSTTLPWRSSDTAARRAGGSHRRPALGPVPLHRRSSRSPSRYLRIVPCLTRARAAGQLMRLVGVLRDQACSLPRRSSATALCPAFGRACQAGCASACARCLAHLGISKIVLQRGELRRCASTPCGPRVRMPESDIPAPPTPQRAARRPPSAGRVDQVLATGTHLDDIERIV